VEGPTVYSPLDTFVQLDGSRLWDACEIYLFHAQDDEGDAYKFLVWAVGLPQLHLLRCCLAGCLELWWAVQWVGFEKNGQQGWGKSGQLSQLEDSAGA
jgi:hypothetical protein